MISIDPNVRLSLYKDFMRRHRVYTSFAEFEDDERRRRPAEPVALARVEAIAPACPSHAQASRPQVTPTSLRAEGIREVGRIGDTSVLYVRTWVKLHLMHSTWLPDRQLDDYAVSLAVAWIEGQGMPSYQAAENLGVNETTLRKALAAAGYQRLSPKQHQQLEHARSSRKIANRRGRLVRAKVNA